jgi:hypothetical protein
MISGWYLLNFIHVCTQLNINVLPQARIEIRVKVEKQQSNIFLSCLVFLLMMLLISYHMQTYTCSYVILQQSSQNSLYILKCMHSFFTDIHLKKMHTNHSFFIHKHVILRKCTVSNNYWKCSSQVSIIACTLTIPWLQSRTHMHFFEAFKRLNIHIHIPTCTFWN